MKSEQFFQLYHGVVIFRWVNDYVTFVLEKKHLVVVLAHSRWVDISSHSDALFWFRSNQHDFKCFYSILEKQQIPIL